MMALQIFVIVIVTLYSFALLMLLHAFRRSSVATTKRKASSRKSIAVVIAVRNEAENIERLLESISNQQCEFPFEIIVSDDESTDDTLARAKAFKERSSVDVRIISSSGAGKKQALTSAVAITDAEIIIVTDGDCVVPESWIQAHAIRYQNEQVQFVAGMVTYKKQSTLLRAVLETELIFLQVASGALFHLGSPAMCNGASMSFRRSFFQSIGGFQSDTRVSGDDLSLLYRAGQRGNGSVEWIFDRDAVVATESAATLAGAIAQRKRWLSKMSQFASFSSLFSGVLFLLAQLLLPSAVLAYACSSTLANHLLLAVGIKSVVELLFLSLAVPFFGEERIIRIFPAAVVLYNFISISAVIALIKRNVNWKGRTWKMGRMQ